MLARHEAANRTKDLGKPTTRKEHANLSIAI
jgi:hypothetical protein